jgi:hypothetical protein
MKGFYTSKVRDLINKKYNAYQIFSYFVNKYYHTNALNIKSMY